MLKLFISITCLAAHACAATSVTVRDAAELQQLFRFPVGSLVVTLMPGTYHLTPSPILDSSCGNCEVDSTQVEATVGLHLRGRKIHLRGPADKSAIIYTHAGYGLYFEDCDDGLIENLTITGGERDTNGMATDAAVVAKNSIVVIRSNLITNNIGDSATVAKKVVGVMGICGREGSALTISNNEIIRNSWDGIALYRGANATIENNIVDGVDKACGTQVGGGRGVGIGVTWNAMATIRQNLVTRYWKGIGLFVDANGVVERNIVEDILTWGIAYWDADKGMPVGFINKNVIYKTGACGASIARTREGDDPGLFTDNIVVETGQNEKYDSPDYYCYQCALALHAVPKDFLIEGNIFYNNRRATSDLPDYDISRDEFEAVVKDMCKDLASEPVFRRSVFLRDFHR
ncbi:MAG: right-handed parallel beta-helix repeat-containing protein [Bacteroidetes bacterium]|nr:right-handed parallel beta-helix repeat-containing protein [Bacteroidota bacterium]MCW5895546.1 right-handed parallel beta-helix repeat-containing protein [Bacteroidota bacterium]